MGAQDNDEMLRSLQQSLSKKKVMVVDRNASSRESLRMLFGTLGMTTIHGAGGAAEVIRQVKQNSFDIIISEFLLEDGRDGQQLLEELRHAKLISRCTVYLIITAERGYTNVVSLAELTPDDYLIKPFTAEQLQPRLIKAIHKKHILKKAYERFESDDFLEAIVACDRVVREYPQYDQDALRLKGEALLRTGRHAEAKTFFEQELALRETPWAKMGLALALRDQGALEEAEKLAKQIVKESPQFMVLQDFLASVYAAEGKLDEAQAILQKAVESAPHNSVRQRQLGDTACRNKDFTAAQRAYGKVIERNRGSSMRNIDDFANLARTHIERGDIDASRKILTELKREFRDSQEAKLAAMTGEILCLQAEGIKGKANEMLEEALHLQESLQSDSTGNLSSRIGVDLAHACYAADKKDEAAQMIRQIAAENNDNAFLLEQIHSVFEKTGQADAGKDLLARVNNEIIELNNRGVIAARQGDFEGSVRLLIEAAEKVPNLQFLVNAAKAIYTLIDQKGWDAELAERAARCLQQAERKAPQNPKIASARELSVAVTRKYNRQNQ